MEAKGESRDVSALEGDFGVVNRDPRWWNALGRGMGARDWLAPDMLVSIGLEWLLYPIYKHKMFGDVTLMIGAAAQGLHNAAAQLSNQAGLAKVSAAKPDLWAAE